MLKIELPITCPTCGFKTERKEQFLYCTNSDCPAITEEKILKFAKILDIKGIGPAIAKEIVAKTYTEYYELLDFGLDDWISVSNSVVIGKKIFAEMNKAKEKFTTDKAIASTFIEGVGMNVGEKLAQLYTFAKLTDLCYADFKAIDGIGDVLALNLSNSFKPTNSIYSYFLSYVKADIIEESKTGGLNGQTFCFTGSQPKGRTELEKLVKDNGGKIASVSKGLDFLVAGEKAGSKLEKATKLNIKIIDYDQFMELINGNNI